MMIDLSVLTLREANLRLRALADGDYATVTSPAGRHNVAVGLDAAIEVTVEGPVGYYVGGLGKHATITVNGPAGWGVGENLMSGCVHVTGDASQSVAASAHGGLVIVDGNASLRAAISLKGASVAIGGDVGGFCGFMAQAGTVLIGGDTGPGLGDSLFEAVIFVAGRIGGLGTDARIDELTRQDVDAVAELAKQAGFDHIDPQNVTKVTSARQLYHFDTHNHGAY